MHTCDICNERNIRLKLSTLLNFNRKRIRLNDITQLWTVTFSFRKTNGLVIRFLFLILFANHEENRGCVSRENPHAPLRNNRISRGVPEATRNCSRYFVTCFDIYIYLQRIRGLDTNVDTPT